ncbi:SDR family NAD(P)-dependent oxidoreductase [Paractinoplanes rishiriensis]|uniref:Short-chain type dehydrogenase/reductase y4lA n=1 Tax=Paractinoplanes rishiriensis TaxID=1050105 RepID=A0A919N0X6_9ACTN|nr:SDR family oxidoreductase [Actinoplanes rishiriensis]GIE95662.1 putative short-chain type dehydrogenase/reductase y4lA [Actinoplanes rishiriensis]
MRGLRGKRILVAGAATGIGAATAARLAEEGVRLFLGDINEEGVRGTAERTDAGVARFDLADADSVAALVAAAVEHLGGLDGVANVAADLSPGTLGNDTALVDLDVAVWEQTLRANLLGFALVGKHAIPHLIAAGGGAVVNTSSAASWAGEPVRPAYAASKAGINALTRHIASAYGKDGVRANSVSPGAVLSETALATMSAEFQARMLAAVTVPRLGQPDDLAATICYLLSDDASWVSGQVWTVNGGGGFRD